MPSQMNVASYIAQPRKLGKRPAGTLVGGWRRLAGAVDHVGLGLGKGLERPKPVLKAVTVTPVTPVTGDKRDRVQRAMTAAERKRRQRERERGAGRALLRS